MMKLGSGSLFVAIAVCGVAIVYAPAFGQQGNTASTAAADPQAYALLKAAHDARETWPADFPGFTSEVVFNDNGRIFRGWLGYTLAKGIEVKVEGMSDDAAQWLKEQFASLLAHRRGGDFAKRDGRYPVTFGEDDKSPAGLLIQLNDSMKSTYRVRDGQTVEVTRTAGDERFTITVLESTTVEAGKYLPRHFTVTYFDAKTGAVRRTEAFTDSYGKVEGVWLPKARRVLRAENGRVTARLIEIHNPRLIVDRGSNN